MRKSRRASKPKRKSTRKKRPRKKSSKGLFKVVFSRNIHGGVKFLNEEMEKKEDDLLMKNKTKPRPTKFMTDKEYIATSVTGKGGNAVIYKGHCMDDDTISLAIKVITKSDEMIAEEKKLQSAEQRDKNELKRNIASEIKENTDAAIKELRRHKALTAMLSDNPIEKEFFVKYIDGGIDDDGHIISVMEYVDGVTLDKLHEILDTLAEDEKNTLKLKILLQLQDGIYALHRRGIVHGDIKPENIMVSRTGDVKYIDMGSLMDHSEIWPDLGTQNYDDPDKLSEAEIAKMVKKNNSKQVITLFKGYDLWALGCVFYSVITGEQHKTSVDIARNYSSTDLKTSKKKLAASYITDERVRDFYKQANDEDIATLDVLFSEPVESRYDSFKRRFIPPNNNRR